jgi:hypothetical protein
MPDICHEPLCLLKNLNPDVDIYGLFGGEEEQLEEMQHALKQMLDNIYSVARYAPSWKWRFSDLALLEWFVNVGKSIDFDVVHLIESDLLLCTPIDRLYHHVPSGCMGLSGVRKVKEIQSSWAPTTMEPLSLEWQKLLSWAKRTYSYSDEPLGCLGPGCMIPRSFLDGYAGLKVPELSMDELRLPLIAQLLQIPIVDNRLCRGWFLDPELQIFNTLKRDIVAATIARELDLPHGRRGFHPYRQSISDIQSRVPLLLNGMSVDAVPPH